MLAASAASSAAAWD